MTAWKVYAIAFSIAAVLSLAGRTAFYFRRPGVVSKLDIVSGAVTVLLLPALIGYAWNRPFLTRSVWIIGAALAIVFSTAELAGRKTRELRRKLTTARFGLTILIQVAAGLPALYAVIRYALFSPQLWN